MAVVLDANGVVTLDAAALFVLDATGDVGVLPGSAILDNNGWSLTDDVSDPLLDNVPGEQTGGFINAGGGIAISRKRWKQLRKELKKDRKDAARQPLVAQDVEPAASTGDISPSGILGPSSRAADRPSAVVAGSTPIDTAQALADATALVERMQDYIALQQAIARHAELLDEEEALIALLAA